MSKRETKTDDRTGEPADESRRAALKRAAKYAAPAMIAMLLSEKALAVSA